MTAWSCEHVGVNMPAHQRMPRQGMQGDPIPLLGLSSLAPSLPRLPCYCARLLWKRDFLTTLQRSSVHKPFTWVLVAWL